MNIDLFLYILAALMLLLGALRISSPVDFLQAAAFFLVLSLIL